jgi:hypothetical protein
MIHFKFPTGILIWDWPDQELCDFVHRTKHGPHLIRSDSWLIAHPGEAQDKSVCLSWVYKENNQSVLSLTAKWYLPTNTVVYGSLTRQENGNYRRGGYDGAREFVSDLEEARKDSTLRQHQGREQNKKVINLWRNYRHTSLI